MISWAERLASCFRGSGPLSESERASVGDLDCPEVLGAWWREHGPGVLDLPAGRWRIVAPEEFRRLCAALPGELAPMAHSEEEHCVACVVGEVPPEPGLVPGSVVIVDVPPGPWAEVLVGARCWEDWLSDGMLGRDPFAAQSLGWYWSEAHRSQAMLPTGVDASDVDVRALHYRTLVPSELLPRVDLRLAGVLARHARPVRLSEQGQVLSLTLGERTAIEGVSCRADTEVRWSATGLYRCTPDETLWRFGVAWQAGEAVVLPTESHAWMAGVLAEPATCGGLPLAAAAARLDEDGFVRGAELSRDARVDGLDLPAGARVERRRRANGEGALVAVRAPVSWWCGEREVAPGERWSPDSGEQRQT